MTRKTPKFIPPQSIEAKQPINHDQATFALAIFALK